MRSRTLSTRRRGAPGVRACALPLLHEADAGQSTSSSPRRPTSTATSAAGTTTRNRPDTLRGLTRVATIVDSLRRRIRVLPVLVDAGDILQGNPLTYVAARVDSTIAAPGHRRDERDAVRRGGDRQSRVQLRTARTLERAMRQARVPVARRERLSRPTARTRSTAWTIVDARRASRSGSSARRRPARWSGIATISRGTARRSRHRARGASGRATRRAPRARTSSSSSCTPGSTSRRATTPSSTGRAERERRGAGRARGAGYRPARLRPLAQGDGGHGHRQHAARCSRRTGRRASRSRISRCNGRTDVGVSARSEVRSLPRRITGERAGSRGDAGRTSGRRGLRERRRSDRRQSRGAPIRRGSSTRR